jgi:hypothetical protein
VASARREKSPVAERLQRSGSQQEAQRNLPHRMLGVPHSSNYSECNLRQTFRICDST